MKCAMDQYAIDKVRALRIQLELTQEQLAEAAHVSSGFIGDVEAGTRDTKYNLRHLNAFARLFKCSPREFLPEQALPED